MSVKKFIADYGMQTRAFVLLSLTTSRVPKSAVGSEAVPLSCRIEVTPVLFHRLVRQLKLLKEREDWRHTDERRLYISYHLGKIATNNGWKAL